MLVVLVVVLALVTSLRPQDFDPFQAGQEEVKKAEAISLRDGLGQSGHAIGCNVDRIAFRGKAPRDSVQDPVPASRPSEPY